MSGHSIQLPTRGRGRQSVQASERYQRDLHAFCEAITEIRGRLDFEVSARGWCYILEETGLGKGDFNRAQTLIAECRKSGLLPLDIVAEDSARGFDNLERIDTADVDLHAACMLESIEDEPDYYTPVSFWTDQPFYLEMLVEKVDLKSLFGPICASYSIPIANARGWSDLNSRAAMMRRFAKWQECGNTPVLLYCGDHDPAGLSISTFMRSNIEELGDAVGWESANLIIDRFGLNADFIELNNLTWIDCLETGSGKSLDHPSHPDHGKPYVREYLQRFGPRKVEANALVVRPDEARNLCREAIAKYVCEDARQDHLQRLQPYRQQLRAAIVQRLQDAAV